MEGRCYPAHFIPWLPFARACGPSAMNSVSSAKRYLPWIDHYLIVSTRPGCPGCYVAYRRILTSTVSATWCR